MTGGRVVVLGPTGLNFAAGMSGGIAYVLDVDGGFRARCNTELVGFDEITPDEARGAARLVEEHRERTGSPVAAAPARGLGGDARPLREGHAARLQARAGRELAPRARPRWPRAAGPPRRRATRPGADLAMGELGASCASSGSASRSATRASACTTTGSTSRCPTTRTLREQGGRCMDCGVPFCHEGCPLGNRIPDWNDLVYRDRWQDALVQLHATNNFPEFTGLICPAPCESACVLDINDDPVTIEQIELAIVTRGFDEGWIDAEPAGRAHRQDGRRGRARARPGLAVAAELNKLGHKVTVYERDEAPGGLLRFGVPDAKLEKWIIDRRVELLEEEGIELRVRHGRGPRRDGRRAARAPRRGGGGDRLARAPRPRGARPRAGRRALRDGLPLPAQPLGGAPGGPPGARDAAGPGDQRRRAGAWSWSAAATPAWTASPTPCARAPRTCCCSTSTRRCRRAGARPARPGRCRPSARPPPTRSTRAASAASAPRSSSCAGEDGRVTGVRGRRVEGTSSRDLKPVPGSEFEEPAELVLIAIGFSHPEHEGAVEQLGLDLDARGNVKAPVYGTKVEGVFACGDARIGPVARGHGDRRGPPLRARRRPVPRRHRRGAPHPAPRRCSPTRTATRTRCATRPRSPAPSRSATPSGPAPGTSAEARPVYPAAS